MPRMRGETLYLTGAEAKWIRNRIGLTQLEGAPREVLSMLELLDRKLLWSATEESENRPDVQTHQPVSK